MKRRGFTLIELLLVISIISLLSSIVLAQTMLARKKARDVVRVSDLQELQKAIELYRSEHNEYPRTPSLLNGNGTGNGTIVWWTGGNCPSGVSHPGFGPVKNKGYGAGGYISGIVPTYISKLPEDSQASLAAGRCYMYRSDGSEYMIAARNGAESFNPNNGHPLDWPATNDMSLAVYSDGAKDWTPR